MIRRIVPVVLLSAGCAVQPSPHMGTVFEAPAPAPASAPISLDRLEEANLLESASVRRASSRSHTARFTRGAQWGGFTVVVRREPFHRECSGFELQLFDANGTWLMTSGLEFKTVTLLGDTDQRCTAKIGLSITRANHQTLTVKLVNRYPENDFLYEVFRH